MAEIWYYKIYINNKNGEKHDKLCASMGNDETKKITTYALINRYGFDAYTLNDLKYNKNELII